jgi:hypothetical protein
MVSAPSALPPNVQLLVASLDLKLVQLLRDAIRTADLTGAALRRATDLGPTPSPEPRPHLHPEPVYEPRIHYHPTPRIEPRLVWRSAAGASPGPCGCPGSAPDWANCPPTAPPAKPDCERPMEPPWKVLPWQNPPPPPPAARVRKIKVFVSRPDSAQKGAAIDLFV